jgi:hypothetical protein
MLYADTLQAQNDRLLLSWQGKYPKNGFFGQFLIADITMQ